MLPTADEKPSASVKEACYKARLLFICCSSRILVSIRSAHRLVLWNYFLKHFAFKLEQKRDLFSSWGEECGEIDKKEKGREVKDLQVPLLVIKKGKKSAAKSTKLPLPLLNNVKTKQKWSQNLRWKSWKKQAIQETPVKHFQEFLFSLRIYFSFRKAGKTGTCTIHHVRLSKHT